MIVIIDIVIRLVGKQCNTNTKNNNAGCDRPGTHVLRLYAPVEPVTVIVRKHVVAAIIL